MTDRKEPSRFVGGIDSIEFDFDRSEPSGFFGNNDRWKNNPPGKRPVSSEPEPQPPTAAESEEPGRS